MTDPSAPLPPAPPEGTGDSSGRKRRLPRRVALIGLGFVVVVLGLGAGAVWSLHRAAPEPPAGEPAMWLYDVKVPDADGVERPLKAWRGTLLVVNFWATWCTPCIEEMPELQKFADEFATHNVAVIGIGVDDADRVRDFRRDHALRLPLLAAGFDGMDLARRLGNPEPVLPYTALISPDGRILEKHSGRIQPPELRKWVAEYGGR